jgi:uncharacterized membrane protein YhaH (DUF805 family)
MNDDLRNQIERNFRQKPIDELIQIWMTNNRVEWTKMTFDVIGEILLESLPELPPQNEPILKVSEQIERKSIDIVYMTLPQLYFSLNGRIGLATYWLKGVLPIIAFAFLLGFILGYIDELYFTYSQYSGILPIAGSLMIIWPGIAVTVKRWHDRDKSGWWILIGLLPILGIIWAFIENGFLPGSKGPNHYGSKSF